MSKRFAALSGYCALHGKALSGSVDVGLGNARRGHA